MVVVAAAVIVPMAMFVSMVVSVTVSVVWGVKHQCYILDCRAKIAIFFIFRKSCHLIKC